MDPGTRQVRAEYCLTSQSPERKEHSAAVVLSLPAWHTTKLKLENIFCDAVVFL